MWHEERTYPVEHERVFTARVGPYFLAVIEGRDGRVTWSVGEGTAGETDELEGVAPDAAMARCAAVREARRRWRGAGEEIGAFEAECGNN